MRRFTPRASGYYFRRSIGWAVEGDASIREPRVATRSGSPRRRPATASLASSSWLTGGGKAVECSVMSDKAFVLIVEDAADRAESIVRSLSRSGHACKVVSGSDEAMASMRQRPPDVIVSERDLGAAANGFDLVRLAREEAPDTEIVLITTAEAGESALEAVDGDGRSLEYVVAPIDADELRRKVDRAVQRAMTARRERLMHEQLGRAFSFEGMIGSGDALAREIKRLTKLAPTKCTVLIVGESGTGKEMVATAIHKQSTRSGKAFVPINCAALSENLLESELFGHVKGAFTGAVGDRKGLLEAADGGTMFLDEIGDMPLSMQAKLLRTLEGGEVKRVGANDVRHVDVRFVAATHRDLWQRFESGDFREDLFYRLHAQGAIRIPPLRERREDIALLVDHFIRMGNEENGRSVIGVTAEALRKLTNQSWRGNVRELKYVVERMVIEADHDMLDVEDLPDSVRGSTDLVPVGLPSLAGLSMADVEKIHILNTLKLTGGNREKAASILKIGARTLYRKLKDYGIT